MVQLNSRGREHNLLASMPALFFFLSLSTMDHRVIGEAPLDPVTHLSGPESETASRLTRAVAERGMPTLFGPMDDVLTHVGRIATELSFGSLAPLNRPGYRLSSFRECFRPLAHAIAAESEFTWWWEGAHTHRVTAKDIGTSPGRDLENESRWSNQPRSSTTIQTTPGPIGPYESTLAVCFDNDTEFGGDHRTMQLADHDSLGRGLSIASAADWAALVEYANTRVTSRSRKRYWSEFLGERQSWVSPDWQRISEAYSWIELTLGGFLSAAYQSINTRVGTSAIVGWTPGATVFFHVDTSPYRGWAEN